MSVLNFLFAPLVSFSLVTLTGPLHHEYHGAFFEVPVMVLHLVLMNVILTYLGYFFIPLQYQHSAVFLSHFK